MVEDFAETAFCSKNIFADSPCINNDICRNGRESPRQSKEEIERESNYEWLGFELGLPTFPFRGYIRRRLGVL